MTPSRLLARPMLASAFVVGAVNALKNSEAVAVRAKPLADKITTLVHRTAPGVPIPTDPKTLVRINAGAQLLSAAALATGRSPRLASTVLATSLVPTTLAGHAFWEEADPATKANQRLHFFKNLSLLGGVLLASVDTEGKP
ncbi:MAG: DoxX family membrane protein, partial [Actinomycetota bacterium]|nr:DoxX family membrane protein [Actinomycetota bacterium]